MNQPHKPQTAPAAPSMKDLPPLPPEPAGAVETTEGLTPVEERGRKTDAAPSQDERAAGRELKSNPASDSVTAFGVSRESRISLNSPDRLLEVPDIEGYHLHWFLEINIPKAKRAGYEFVSPAEVPTVDRSIGGRTEGSHSEDLGGDRVSQIAGVGADGRPLALVLMKIKLEWYFDDQRKIAARNRAVLDQIFRKRQPLREPGESETDFAQRYTREAAFDMSNGRFRKTT